MNTADLINNSPYTSDRSLILLLALKIDAQEKEIISLKENQTLKRLAYTSGRWLPRMEHK